MCFAVAWLLQRLSGKRAANTVPVGQATMGTKYSVEWYLTPFK